MLLRPSVQLVEHTGLSAFADGVISYSIRGGTSG
ncbi:MAG: hypothetical protein ACI9P3_001669 [Bradyrhizobium sp.]|jgi:hypothetical protein